MENLTVPNRSAPRYAAITEALEAAISEGRLAPATVISEEPVARAFGTSRTPARKALAELVERGRLERFEGRGFLVAGAGKGAAPRRIELTAESLGADAAPLADVPRQRAERIAETFERVISSALPFGRFRINEVAAAEYHGVSRTVIRELLQRHQDRGLVRKDRRSHWIVGPLTARDISHYFAIRQQLEPLALRDSAPRTPTSVILTMIEETEAAHAVPLVSSAEVARLERDLHWTLLQRTPNGHLLRFIEQSQIALVVNAVFSDAIGGRPFQVALREHLIVLEFLRRGSVEAASQALAEHLHLSAERTQRRLMSLSVFPPPELPGYMMRETRFNE
ncbi:transcriptional regulator, GntR family protein [Oceanicola granulosus HTCC2516]|uniref:Transcriptional regulator, GntR family protein n=1 Tax=Oceanicola granulosus (strain ATCC BAA-861 / DSM 15982 / KCTC 12143 / HTCC2516) TaxID=314256 RepID=Q2CGK7_OCEGH|nr:GntR family transcriptional regulator [Oceanicola granulosus]EAR51711.1 transcriptional regulator, GntR family protein [Oceanicola granulosus HTCC2516]